MSQFADLRLFNFVPKTKTTMKKLLLLSSLLCTVLLAPTLTFAAKADGPKAKAMAQFDLNKDGKFNEDEITAMRSAYAANADGDLKRYDTDADGKLSDSEIAQIITGSGKKGEGKKSGKKADEKTPEAEGAKKGGKKKSDK